MALHRGLVWHLARYASHSDFLPFGLQHQWVKYHLVGDKPIVLQFHGSTRGGWPSLCSMCPGASGFQKASEPVVGPSGASANQVWHGLHNHFEAWAAVAPPTQQIQGYGQPSGYVGQRCQNDPSWCESTIHWPLAIELAIDPAQRQFQLDASQALIHQADGGLGPMTGQERLWSLFVSEPLFTLQPCFTQAIWLCPAATPLPFFEQSNTDANQSWNPKKEAWVWARMTHAGVFLLYLSPLLS